jgi:hypothetical protein
MMKRVVPAVARRLGYEIRRIGEPDDRAGLDAHEAAVLKAVRPYTMTSSERVLALVRATRYVSRNHLPGAFVECGVWRGGSMLATALTLCTEGDMERELFLFDTFEGMSVPTDMDRDLSGSAASELLASSPRGSSVWAEASLEDVQQTLSLSGYPAERIHFVRGKVEDTLPHAALTDIALLRLDTDWYESTAHELKHLYPALRVGGVLIIDDYGHWLGARRATDEYFAQPAVAPVLLNPIDYTGRIAVKVAMGPKTV